jgi:hypothetical protein
MDDLLSDHVWVGIEWELVDLATRSARRLLP